MACKAVEIWTISSLVGAYLDLTLTSLFLIGATIAYFTSKFLSVFGLSLPCSCNGHFGHPACIQADLLIDLPASKVTAVKRSLFSRFPYDSNFSSGALSSPRCRYVRLPSEDRDSCTAASLSRPSRSLSMPSPSPSTYLRRRSCKSFDDSVPNQEKFRSASAVMTKDDSQNVDDEEIDTVLVEETTTAERDLCFGNEDVSRCENGDLLAIMRSLQRDFEDEKAARAALYMDLEKERNAASTAADEAMAMILRLQKEKAEIEMESRQYQRMIEEKYAYDAEEMEILKEIILRCERENHVLLKEIDMYKQMLDSLETFDQEFNSDQTFSQGKLRNMNESSDLQQIFNSIGKKKVAFDFKVDSSSLVNSSGDFSNLGNYFQNFIDAGKKAKLLNGREEYDNCLDKNLLTEKDSILHSISTYEAEYQKDIADLTVRDGGDEGLSGKTDEADQRGGQFAPPDIGSGVYDVHIIDEKNAKQNPISPEVIYSSTISDPVKADIRRSCSEITNTNSLFENPFGRASYFDLRRSSLSTVDSEKFKLESEVELLRKRLDFIRQGREKLNLSTDHKEKETFQLKLLDEIALQLKEIKKVTEPTKSFRRASLPPQRL